jgi:hypothetical protein
MEKKHKGCHRCFNGQVIFTQYGKRHYGDCAYCSEGEQSNYQTYMVQKNDRIYPAYRAVGFKHIADPNQIEAPIVDSEPVYTNARLHEIAASPMLGTMTKEARAQLFARRPLKGATVVNNTVVIM